MEEERVRTVPDLLLPQPDEEVLVQTMAKIRIADKARWTGVTWIFEVTTNVGMRWITSTPEGWVECSEEGSIEKSSSSPSGSN